MSRLKILMIQTLVIIIVSAVIAMIWVILPNDIFTTEKNKIIFGFISALFAAVLTGYSLHFLSKYIERPVIRIEHVDFKTERKPFKLDENLWWHITHGPIMGYAKNNNQWLIEPLQKNEIQHFHLRDLEELVNQTIKTYMATSLWTSSTMSKLDKFKKAPNDNERISIIEDFAPDIVRFEEHYRESGKGALFEDLKDKPEQASAFLLSEMEGLLLRHDREIKNLKGFKSWIIDMQTAGTNEPIIIDHSKQEVPRIRVFIGVTNIGKTPALIRTDATLQFDNREFPLRHIPSNSTLVYTHIESNGVSALSMEIHRPECSFKDQQELYQALIDRNHKNSCGVIVKLADGTSIKRTKVDLNDNSELRV